MWIGGESERCLLQVAIRVTNRKREWYRTCKTKWAAKTTVMEADGIPNVKDVLREIASLVYAGGVFNDFKYMQVLFNP